MKRISAVTVLILCGLTACNNISGEQVIGITHDKNTISEKTDPVCGMIKDSTWTDYTVYKGDTVWFCAPAEKDAFIANPKKYIK